MEFHCNVLTAFWQQSNIIRCILSRKHFEFFKNWVKPHCTFLDYKPKLGRHFLICCIKYKRWTTCSFRWESYSFPIVDSKDDSLLPTWEPKSKYPRAAKAKKTMKNMTAKPPTSLADWNSRIANLRRLDKMTISNWTYFFQSEVPKSACRLVSFSCK